MKLRRISGLSKSLTTNLLLEAIRIVFFFLFLFQRVSAGPN